MKQRKPHFDGAIQVVGDIYAGNDSSIASNLILATSVVEYESPLSTSEAWLNVVHLAKKLLLARKKCKADNGIDTKVADSSRAFRKALFRQLKVNHDRIAKRRSSAARTKPVPVLGDGKAVVGEIRGTGLKRVAREKVTMKPGKRIVLAREATEEDWARTSKALIVQEGTMFLEEGMVRSVCGGTWTLAWEDYKTRYEYKTGVGDSLRLKEKEHKRISSTNNIPALAEMSRKILTSPLAVLDSVLEETPEVEEESDAFLKYFKLLLGSGIIGYQPHSENEVTLETFVEVMKAKIKLMALNGTSFSEWVKLYFLHHEPEYNSRINTVRGGTGWEQHRASILAENKIRTKKDFLQHLYRRMLRGHRIL